MDNSGELAVSDRVNSVGYSVGDGSNGADIGVIIPAHATQAGVDCFGNTLTYGAGYPALPIHVQSAGRGFNEAWIRSWWQILQQLSQSTLSVLESKRESSTAKLFLLLMIHVSIPIR